MNERILVIDDEHLVLDAVKVALKETDIVVETASSPEEGIRLFRKSPNAFVSILVDNQYKQENQKVEVLGPLVVREIRKLNPQVQVVMLSGDYSSEALKSWKEAGADKNLWKPFKKEQLLAYIELAREQKRKIEQLCEDTEDFYANQREKMAMDKLGVIGVSKAMGEVALKAFEHAKKEITVMLLGETGTGKEVFARGIHKNSLQVETEFISVDCTRYKDKTDLFESEMFGHVKGAFTGADRDRTGFVEAADGGTLFLDEIHHLNADAQAKLLRLIQNRSIVKVGEHKEKPVQFRLIVAAKPSLRKMVEEGTFLPDLFFRIYELDLLIPTLNDRKEDIKPLILHFLKKHSSEKEVSFAQGAYFELKKHDWPGNVRELEMVIKKSIINSKDEKIMAKDLCLESIEQKSNEMSVYTMKKLEEKQLKEKTKLVLRALTLCDNNKKHAADMLDMKRTTLIDFLTKNNLKNVSSNEARELLSSI